MRAGVIIAGTLAFVVSLVFVTWLLQSPAHTAPQATFSPKAAQNPEAALPPRVDVTPSKTGPHPKAVITETSYDFGRIPTEQVSSHVFVIRNEGEAPLKLKLGEPTCQCTTGLLTNNVVAPGDSAEITLRLKEAFKPAFVPTQEFDQGVEVFTNDPEHKSIPLRIQATVLTRFGVLPSTTWNMQTIKETQPTEFQGSVGSGIFKFQILELRALHEKASVRWEPMSEEELAKNQFESGYNVTVVVPPDMPLGVFNFTLLLKTDCPSDREAVPVQMEIGVTGVRHGPLRLLGPDWREDYSAVSMGTFSADEGKKSVLTVFVLNENEQVMEISDVQCDPPELKVSLKHDDAYAGKAKKYFLTLEYPAGSPRTKRHDPDPATVKFKTNHPLAPTVELKAYLSAY